MNSQNTAKEIKLFPAGTVTLPPSKSLSHRALICAALAAANGENSKIYQLGQSVDIGATTACMQNLCADIAKANEEGLFSVGPKKAKTPQTNTLYCAESGSTLRFLIPIAAMLGKEFNFTGQGRLLQRPLGVYKDVFAQSGAFFKQTQDMVSLKGPLAAGTYCLPGDVSSQFLSGLILALPLAQKDSRLVLTSPLESAAYVNLTISVMQNFGVFVSREKDGNFHIPGGQKYRGATYTVEADYSQAAFFLGAAALGRPVACAGLSQNSLQGDFAILSILQKMGCNITWENGLVKASAPFLKAATIDVREIPDLVPPLAVLCSFAKGTSHIVNAARLRFKESDRLMAMAKELAALGAEIKENKDSLVITGKTSLQGGMANAHADHRIAMASALAAIGCTGTVSLSGWQSVEKSYPNFWDDFEKEAKNG